MVPKQFKFTIFLKSNTKSNNKKYKIDMSFPLKYYSLSFFVMGDFTLRLLKNMEKTILRKRRPERKQIVLRLLRCIILYYYALPFLYTQIRHTIITANRQSLKHPMHSYELQYRRD